MTQVQRNMFPSPSAHGLGLLGGTSIDWARNTQCLPGLRLYYETLDGHCQPLHAPRLDVFVGTCPKRLGGELETISVSIGSSRFFSGFRWKLVTQESNLSSTQNQDTLLEGCLVVSATRRRQSVGPFPGIRLRCPGILGVALTSHGFS